MKKITLMALAGMVFLPTAMKAESFSTEVSTKSEFTAAIDAISTGIAGETYEIILTNDVSDEINTGNLTINIETGRVIIRSEVTDYDEMPILQTGFSWGCNTTEGAYGQQLSLIFENVNLQFRSGNTASSGQVIYFNGVQAPIDTIAFRNCEITNIPRTLYRSVPEIDSETGDTIIKTIDVLELKNCRVHDMNISSGNSWFTLVVGQFINTLNIEDNMFYDMPYSKGVWQMSRVSETGAAPTVNFIHNAVFSGGNNVASNRFTVLSPGSCLGVATTYNINNNMFIAPQEGLLVEDTCEYDGAGKLVSMDGGIVFASNNVIDTLGWTMWDADEYMADGTWTYASVSNNYSLEDAEITSWEAGDVFQDASKSLYYMLTSSKTYTMGTDGSYLGAAGMYVDEFPVVANVNVAIEGADYVTYDITPSKEEYYVGDEITITIDDHNSYYRTFNTFDGWSDGETEMDRTIALEGDLDITANFTNDNSVIAAFDFSTITSNSNMSSYDADIYYNMDSTYQAVAKGYVNDTASSQVAPFDYIEGNFQCRAAKFGEDEEELQMAIISRRTAAIAKESQRDYVAFEICTTGMSDINFSCFVGTDNNAALIQALEYSTDSTTWERLDTVHITNGIWSELNAALPESADDQEKVYVRVIGDLSEGHVVTPDPDGGLVDDDGNEDTEAYEACDAFEYIGNVLITTGTTSGIKEIYTDEETDEDAPIYNLMGMKVDKSAKGILIQNGKKFISK